MRDCEQHEILVSAWQDGELDRGGQVEMIDHLVACARCREFYRDVRGLDGLAEIVRPPAPLEQPAPEIWERIERAIQPGDAARIRGGGSPMRRLPIGPIRRLPIGAWATAAAAMVMLLVALGSPLGRRPDPAVPGTGGAAIRLGENPGGMDDARFIALTEQVLGSDRRYREAFYRVMKQVVEDTGSHETSVDTLRPRSEGGRTGETGGAARGRS